MMMLLCWQVELARLEVLVTLVLSVHVGLSELQAGPVRGAVPAPSALPACRASPAPAATLGPLVARAASVPRVAAAGLAWRAYPASQAASEARV